jgi:hypothetical protein
MTEDIMNTLSAHEVELAQAIIETDEQTAEVDMKLQKLALAKSKQTGEHTKYDAETDIADELKEESNALRISQRVFKELLSEAHHVRTGQRLNNIDMSDGGQLLVGLINVQGDTQVAQDMSNVFASRGGRGIVGVANNVDVNSFFGKLTT